ncbi:MAG: HupE/UreJ family protein [Cyanobacteria bacterium P01_G01_bin.38]
MFGKLLRSTTAKGLLAVLSCLLCVMSATGAIAHSSGQSYLYFQIGENTITTRAEIPVKDLNEVLNLGFPPDRKKMRPEEVDPHLETIKDYVAQNLDIGCAPQTCELTFQTYELLNTGGAGQFIKLSYAVEGFQTLPEALQVNYDPILADKAQYTNMLLIEENWKTGTFANESEKLLVYTAPDRTHTLDLTDGSFLQGFTSVVKLGIIHIVEGIDHVLFLVALLLPSVVRRGKGGWQPVGKFSTAFIYIIKIATVFTIAHSITLGLATLQIVQIPARFVESVIAASIGLAAIEIFYPIFRGRVWFVIFAFGLFHGFGFAEVLSDLGVTSQYALLSLFGFNLGVEIGQLAIIAVVFPLFYLLRKSLFYSRFVLKTGGLALGAMSLYWFVERAFDVNIQVLPVLQGLL